MHNDDLMDDIVAQYIETKKNVKAEEEKMRALELIVREKHRNDPRIKIIPGRESIVLKDIAYETLEAVGVQTTVTETITRNKTLAEFDVVVRESILANSDNYTKTVTKESVRIVGEK